MKKRNCIRRALSWMLALTLFMSSVPVSGVAYAAELTSEVTTESADSEASDLEISADETSEAANEAPDKPENESTISESKEETDEADESTESENSDVENTDEEESVEETSKEESSEEGSEEEAANKTKERKATDEASKEEKEAVIEDDEADANKAIDNGIERLDINGTEVTFIYIPHEGETVTSVTLMGINDDWNVGEPLEPQGGRFSITLTLEAKDYSYKYKVNNEWTSGDNRTFTVNN